MKNAKSFAHNTAVLFISMIISKVVGALFKIPLTNIIGGVGMGYYSTAYSLFTPIFAVTAAGIPTVIVKATAKNIAIGQYANSTRILKTALAVFGSIGIAGSIITAMLATSFSEIIAQSPESRFAIFAIAPSIVLCCISSVLRGYYEGMCNMTPTAVSQVIESITRAVAGLTLTCLTVYGAIQAFNNGEAVFGIYAQTAKEAVDISLPYAAAAATFAVTLSELVCTLIMCLRYKFAPKSEKIMRWQGNVESYKKIAVSLLKDCFPVAICSVAINLSSFVDMITITRCISFGVSSDPYYFKSMFGEIINSFDGTVEIANFMYGSYTGLSGTVFMLIPAFTGMFGKSALGEIAASFGMNDKAGLKRKLSLVIKSNMIIGFPLFLGMAVMSREILEILYKSRPNEITVSITPLFIMCLGGVFLTLSSTFIAIFQVIERPDLPIKLMLTSAAVKIIFNVFLISIPQININGAAVSTVISYAVAAIGGCFALENITGIEFRFINTALIPLFSSVITAILARFCYEMSIKALPATAAIAFSAFVACLFYLFLLIITGNIQVENLLKRRKLKKQ